jgi:hypothetical protein
MVGVVVVARNSSGQAKGGREHDKRRLHCEFDKNAIRGCWVRLTFRGWNALQASDCRSVPKEWIEAEASVRSLVRSGKRVSGCYNM